MLFLKKQFAKGQNFIVFVALHFVNTCKLTHPFLVMCLLPHCGGIE